jgi:hypothetical protein
MLPLLLSAAITVPLQSMSLVPVVIHSPPAARNMGGPQIAVDTEHDLKSSQVDTHLWSRETNLLLRLHSPVGSKGVAQTAVH